MSPQMAVTTPICLDDFELEVKKNMSDEEFQDLVDDEAGRTKNKAAY